MSAELTVETIEMLERGVCGQRHSTRDDALHCAGSSISPRSNRQLRDAQRPPKPFTKSLRTASVLGFVSTMTLLHRHLELSRQFAFICRSRNEWLTEWLDTSAAFVRVCVLSAVLCARGGLGWAVAAEPALDAKDLPRVPPTEPAEVGKTFQVRPGFRMELVAAEPLVVDPIAMSFDENGRLFVVEMRDYSERRDERLGTVRVLEDSDGDGRFDKSRVFVKDLPWPTAVLCYDGGAFVGASPDIYYCKDTDGDGVADVREVVFTGFGAGVERLNVQALLNTFTWGLDNRIHGATSGNGGKVTSPKHPGRPAVELRGRDFSFDPRTLELRPESGGGQHGLSFDDAGRKFVCSNNAHLQMLMYEDYVAGRNPFYSLPSPLVNIAEDGPAAEVYRISPDEPWRVVRTRWRVSGLAPGPIEGGGKPSGYFTGATGVTIYRGHAWPEEYRGDAFIADCGSNLIHRKKLHPHGVGFVGRRASDELKREFAASTDNWFRPVQFANAPDGNLYVADMYREVIEHPWSLPEAIKRHLDLNSGNDRGRIYRIAAEGFQQPPPVRLASLRAADLVKTLDHPNGWHRDTAARLLYERQYKDAAEPLERLLRDANSPLGRLHALYALNTARALTGSLVAERLADADSRVREHAVRLSRPFLASSETVQGRALALTNDPAPRVRYELAFLAAEMAPAQRRSALLALALRDHSDPWMRAAILNSLGTEANHSFFASLLRDPAANSAQESLQTLISELLALIAAQKKRADVSLAIADLAAINDPARTRLLARSLLEGLRRAGVKPTALDSKAQNQLKKIQAEALRAVADTNEPVLQRVAAIQLLGALDWRESGEALANLLGSEQAAPVQQAALSALSRFREPEAAATLLRHWPRFTPRERSEALGALLSRPSHAALLLDAAGRGEVRRAELAVNQVDFLRNHRDPAIRKRAIELFGPKESSDRAEVVQRFQGAWHLAGDAARGAKIFRERCASCHRLGAEGYDVGPDLAGARASGKEKLLVSILDPNREVSPSFLGYEVETTDGETLAGLIAAENASGLTLKRAYGDQTVVPRARIRRLQSLSQSVMPEGLEADLTLQDMADLLEFIVGGGGRP